MKIKDTVHFKWYKHVFIGLIIGGCFYTSALVSEADFTQLFDNTNNIFFFLSRFLNPDFNYVPLLVFPLLKTLSMALLGTTIGIIVAVPFSFLATTIVIENRIIVLIFRFLLGVVRTIPTLLLAALFVAIFGIGEVTGVLSISVFTFGMVSQLLFQAIETIDLQVIESIKAVGGNRMQIIFWAVVPQVYSQLISYSFYAFEVNVRASTILGYVGAGGIGVMLNTSLALMNYERVSVIVLTILILVSIIDKSSEWIRGKVYDA